MLRLTFAIITLFCFSTIAHAEGISARFGYLHDRQVVLQGEAGQNGLAGICGPKSEKCRCIFFGGEQDSRIFTTAPTRASLENGTLTCPFPPGAETQDYSHVSVKSKNHGTSARAEVKTKLRLADVLGDLPKNKVNRVYKYTCERGFFEGEGVETDKIACDLSDKGIAQRLGYLRAPYDYYLFQNDTTPGFNVPIFTASFFPGICGRQANEFTRASCSNLTPMQFGLYDKAGGLFQAKVQLTTAPEPSAGNPNVVAEFGFAAVPDRHGKCAPGLEPAYAWEAKPKSITAGSIDGQNPPSNFLNDSGSVTNTVIGSKRPAHFTVTRFANASPCELNGVTPGSCAGATFLGPVIVQSVAYKKTNRVPQVCVIAKRMITEDDNSSAVPARSIAAPEKATESSSAE